jgi:group I intron endonuclease
MSRFSFNSIPDCICIYKIGNTINDKVYIGSTTSLSKRIVQHRYNYINNKNYCPKLYNAIDIIGSDNFYVEIIEVFVNINMIELHNKECYYMNQFDSINNGYNERQDVNGKCITSTNTSKKMSNSGKEVWAKGRHKNHDRKLSKFRYDIYDAKSKELIDKDITTKTITDKYNIASSNIFMTAKQHIIKKVGWYDETETIEFVLKNCLIKRSYIGGTTRDKNKKKDIDINKLTFRF